MATDLIIMPSMYDQRASESPPMIDFLDDAPTQQQRREQHAEAHSRTTNEWACPKCTLLNPEIAPICSLCREINPSVVQESNEIVNHPVAESELVTVSTSLGQASPSPYSNYTLHDADNTRQIVASEVGQGGPHSYGDYQLDEDAALARQLAAQDASQAAVCPNYELDDAAIARQLAASEGNGFAVVTSIPATPNNGTTTALVPAAPSTHVAYPHAASYNKAVVDLATKKRRRSRRRARMVLAGSTGLIVGAVTLGPVGAVAGTAIGATAARMASKNAERRKDERVRRAEQRTIEDSYLPNNNSSIILSNNSNSNEEEDSIRQIT